ncbi:hypothetical protein [Leptospira ilyithenensis]|uniref:DUF3592 domain-containing protein n=1 Tax=Leptospira ilyithenensis TaxID=2484901 RepID=A0A4R9LXR1_9LEPT|nr:hypothetical protein [Leptospira ilyithenensis]TGN14541.1 hypothetical protein EHS11_00680 [Leptospira ilyithenensis]
MVSRIPIWVANTVLTSFLFFCIMFFVVSNENRKLHLAYNRLNDPHYANFATIQEIIRVKNKFPILYQCHYTFFLENGTLVESSESIPYEIYKKLKLGDSIQIASIETSFFGRKLALSKIKNNTETPPLLENLERFFRGGVALFAILSGLSLLFRAWGLKSRTYPSPQK